MSNSPDAFPATLARCVANIRALLDVAPPDMDRAVIQYLWFHLRRDEDRLAMLVAKREGSDA